MSLERAFFVEVAWDVRRVMPEQLSRRFLQLLVLLDHLHNLNSDVLHCSSFQPFSQFLNSEATLTQHSKLILCKFDHCAFKSVLASFAINNRDLLVVEVVEDVDWFCWTHMAEEVGARCTNR